MSSSNMNFTSKAENTLSEAHSLASSYSHIESKFPAGDLAALVVSYWLLVTPLHIAFALLNEEEQGSRLSAIFSKTAGDIQQFERSLRRQLVRLPSQVSFRHMALLILIGTASRTIVIESG